MAAAFDVQQPVRVYGATADGRLLLVNLGNAKTFQNCHVRSCCRQNTLWCARPTASD